MLLLGSTGYDFSLTWTSCVHVTTIQSRWEDIYCMIAEDLMGIGTPEEICWSILLCFWFLIRMLSHSMTINFFWSLSPFLLFLYISCTFRLVFFSLNQQFITWRAKADRGSYFCNYIQRKHTNREIKRKREKVLWSMPHGINKDKEKGYDDNDWLHRSSLSQRLMW